NDIHFRSKRMTHPLIDQFHFTRSEWLRGIEGVSEEDGARHFGQMNSIGWTVGHLAWHEQRSWLTRPQGKILFPQLITDFAFGAPMSTPSFNAMLDIWHMVTKAADPFLDSLTTELLLTELLVDGKAVGQSIGSALRRVTYHYWYHIGEIQAIRQILGQSNLPEYVGDIETEAPYRAE
ncbi:MAG TPA: DinB family protein, partial [Anaerolineae bacterium]|nr:DinB family protein [Anaerolineae bacterium]